MLKDRLRQARKAAKRKQEEVAAAVGMTQSNYSQLETGRAATSIFLPAIADYLKVDAYWLQTGEESRRMIDVTPLPVGQDGVPINQVRLVEYDDVVEVPYYEEFPGSCGGGRLVEALEGNYRMIPIRREILNRYKVNQSDVKAFPSDGKSMVPTIQDKAVVFVDMSRKRIIDEKVYAVCHGGLFKFKQLFNLPLKGIRIVSANVDEYPEERLTKEQVIAQEFEVVGYAFWVEQGLP